MYLEDGLAVKTALSINHLKRINILKKVKININNPRAHKDKIG